MARPPALQCVSARVPGLKSSAACAAIRRQRSTSSSWSARARSGVGSSRIRASAHGRLTAVGRELARTPLGFGEVVVAQRGEREPVRSRDADRRRAAHDHVPDRVGHLRSRRAANVDDFVRQRRWSRTTAGPSSSRRTICSGRAGMPGPCPVQAPDGRTAGSANADARSGALADRLSRGLSQVRCPRPTRRGSAPAPR